VSSTFDNGSGGGRLVQLRDYARSMHERLLRLRDTARAAPSSAALDEAFEELEVTREELCVADEELGRLAAALEEARQHEEALLRHYRDLFDGAPNGYAVTDPRGMIREGNRTLATMLGVHPQFLSRKPLVNFVVRGDVRTFRVALARLAIGQLEGEILRVGLRPRHKQPPFMAEILTRGIRVDGVVTSIRWAIRRGSADARAEQSPQREARGEKG
jgi:PAS domain-containing protein